MRTNSGELIAKPFGLVSGTYALSKTGELCHRAAQVFAFVGVFVSLIVFRSGYLPALVIPFYVITFVSILVLSMAARRNGQKLS